MPQLAEKIRAKYPGQYDDMSDDDLEKAVLAKHPEYKDLVEKPKKFQPKIDTAPSGGTLYTQTPEGRFGYQQNEPEAVNPAVVKSNLQPVAADEPSTFMGGFIKGLKEEFIPTTETFTRNPMLQSAAHPQSLGDILSLVLPSELPNLSRLFGGRGNLSEIADAAKSSESINPNAIPANIPTTTAPRPSGPWDVNPEVSNIIAHPEVHPGVTEDTIYDLARNKFNMGKDLPVEEKPLLPPSSKAAELPKDDWTAEFAKPKFEPKPSQIKPTAEFLGLQQNGEPLFNIKGGEFDRSTKSLQFLKDNNIEVPEIPADAKPMKGEQLRELAIKNKSAVKPEAEIPEWKRRQDWFKQDTQRMRDEAERLRNNPIHQASQKAMMDDWNTTQSNLRINSQVEKEFGIDFMSGSDKSYSDLSPAEQAKFDARVEELQAEKGYKSSTIDVTPSKKPNLLTDESGVMNISSGEQKPLDLRTRMMIARRTPQTLEEINNIGRFANEAQKKNLYQELRDANRTVLTAYDFSAPGRQGAPLMLNKSYWTSFDDMFKSWGSQHAYDMVKDSIYSHPNFTNPISSTGKVMPSIAERAGLNIRGNEEFFQSGLAEKIPIVTRSERAYNAFLGKLRSDTFNSMIEDAQRLGLNPKNDDVLLKKYGSFINDATGRGSLGKLEKAAPILNEVFFAPRLMASRINMYRRVLNPLTYITEDPVIRKQTLKSLIALVGVGNTIGQVAKFGGAQVSGNSNSSDFGKIKIGNSRIDPFAGFQQYAVGASRLLSGKTASSMSGKSFDLTSGKFGMPTRASIVSNFMTNKLAPIPSFVWSWLDNKEFDGTPFDAKKALLTRTVPIVMQDLMDIYKEDPKLFPPGVFKDNPELTKVGMGALPIMGVGMQTYGR